MSETNGYRHFSGLKGTKIHHVGADETAFRYTDIQSAIDAAQNNDLILIEPGTYTLTSKLTVNKPLTIKGMAGPDKIIITSADDLGDSLVDVNVPGAYSTTVENIFENIYFKGADADQNVIDIDNDGGANKKFKVRFRNCIVELASSAATGIGVNVDHTYATTEIQVKFDGKGWEKIQAVDFLTKHASDGCEFFNVRMTASDTRKALATSTDDIASVFKFIQCRLPHEAASEGGHASQSIACVSSWSFVGGATYAAADTNDLTGSHTEVIVA